MKELLKDLCTIVAPSGEESPIAEYLVKTLQPYCAEVTIGQGGSVFAKLQSGEFEHTILLDAHIDQVGFVVTSLAGGGFLRFANVGGADQRVLPATEVIIHGKRNIKGVITSIPPHLSGKSDSAVPIDKLFADTGLSEKEVKELVQTGCRISYAAEFAELLNNRVTSPAIDNRAGVAALISVAKKLSQANDLKCNVCFLFSVGEETFAKGAKTGAFALEFDKAIAVDVSFATQGEVIDYPTPGVLGGGPMVCYSGTLSKAMSALFESTATAHNIPYQTEVCGGTTGTNIDHIGVAKTGAETGLISIPLRYMHTQSEVVDVGDIEATADLIAASILDGGMFNAE
ncbi:MAG: M20/M25/M40 family metallo-hydrolase [Oscillospiraceae bacterium]|jgi:endoglucanase|nr:M20/M25/M40 family metallo-hydrolase [Oscillospiraceae bacterium]